MSRPDDEEPDESTPNARSIAEAAGRLQKIGERLGSLTPEQLASLPLDDSLRDAVVEARRLPPRTKALRRQLQFIGRLMRSADAEAIERQVDWLTSGAPAAELQRLAERWRERLLAEGDAALQALVSEHPDVNRQRLRQMVRRTAKQPAATRERTEAEIELAAELRSILRPAPRG